MPSGSNTEVPVSIAHSALERHYTVKEISELWKLDPSTVRRIFQDRPGVFKIPHIGRRAKRDYVSLRIPESTLLDVHRSHTGRKA